MTNDKYTMANMDLIHPPASIPTPSEVGRLAIKAARLAEVYGLNWRNLSQDERRKFVGCVKTIESVAEGAG